MDSSVERSADLDGPMDRYRQMRRIREFESRSAVLYRDGEVPGFVHLSVGQEAVPVGRVLRAARPTTSSPPPTAGTATCSPRASTCPACSPS